ncbi:MAG: DNA mismatch repair protein MutL, partial [Sphaerochaetaceae bacterium]
PYRFEVERDTDAFLLENSYIYSDFGIELTRPEDLIWEIDTIPLISKGVEDRIASFIKDSTGDIEEIEKNLFSTLACKAAIKAGDEVDSLTAIAILDKVLKMEKPVCPHGRIFITEITEQSLREAVGRFK